MRCSILPDSGNTSGRMEPAQHEDAVHAVYDPVADVYDDHYGDRRCRAENKVLARRFKDLAVPILDLGCGTGLLLDLLPNRDRLPGLYRGVDVAPKMLKQAQRKYPAHLFTEMDMAGPFHPEWGGIFASAVCLFSFCYLPDASAAVREWKRLLRPGGSITILTACAQTWGTPGTPSSPCYLPDRAGLRVVRQFWGPETLSALLTSAGFYGVEARHFSRRWLDHVPAWLPQPVWDGLVRLDTLISGDPGAGYYVEVTGRA